MYWLLESGAITSNPLLLEQAIGNHFSMSETAKNCLIAGLKNDVQALTLLKELSDKFKLITQEVDAINRAGNPDEDKIDQLEKERNRIFEDLQVIIPYFSTFIYLISLS